MKLKFVQDLTLRIKTLVSKYFINGKLNQINFWILGGGDSGGPLQIYNIDSIKCMYTILGVTSYGHTNCGSAGVPGIYTRVSNYLDWIEAIVWKEQRK